MEVTVKYATCQNNGWKWYLVKLFIILFTDCLRVHLLMLFLYKPEICLKCHCFRQYYISMICYKKKMIPTIFHHFLNLVEVCEDSHTELRAHPPTPLYPFLDFTFFESGRSSGTRALGGPTRGESKSRGEHVELSVSFVLD